LSLMMVMVCQKDCRLLFGQLGTFISRYATMEVNGVGQFIEILKIATRHQGGY